MALGNASLLGVGYLMMGRRRLALGTGVVTVALLALLVLVARVAWFQGVVLLWWAGVIAHGWWLAGGRLRRSEPVQYAGPVALAEERRRVWRQRVRRQRLVGLGTALVVLLAVGYLRFDASRIEQDAAAAHRQGDCMRALSTLGGLWAGHRMADAPLTVRAEDSSGACELLVKAGRQAAGDRLLAAGTLKTYRAHPGALWQGAEGRRADLFLAQAAGELNTALTGDTKALEAGFGHLSQVLGEFTGRETEVGKVLDGFLGGLPVKDACDTRTITDWLAKRPAGGGVLDRAADVVPKVAPAAIVGCGDDFAEDKDWKQAKAQYEQLLDQYPKDDLAARAKKGKERAGLQIELANVRRLLKARSGDEPKYCADPAPYRGADRYRGKGPHRAMVFGRSDHKKKLPSSWLAKDAADAVLVICAGDTKDGSAVRTCPYNSTFAIGGVQNVTFRKRKIPVRVYELRTGKRVGPKSVQIGGSSCPPRIHYTYYGSFDTGPPSEMFVKSSTSDVRAAYGSLIRP
ncbi:hypothetical protein ABZ897_36455 [Nonomuraea sp. NPDC046802]|uniref:hypothetical protein n=1 Tax=Nonomuraea sp. NPDC046802 TaxID=3154919 RepID=UPI0033EA5377